jgi:hypothetical protein
LGQLDPFAKAGREIFRGTVDVKWGREECGKWQFSNGACSHWKYRCQHLFNVFPATVDGTIRQDVYASGISDPRRLSDACSVSKTDNTPAIALVSDGKFCDAELGARSGCCESSARFNAASNDTSSPGRPRSCGLIEYRDEFTCSYSTASVNDCPGVSTSPALRAGFGRAVFARIPGEIVT